jgi:hypothetical protein
MYRPSAGWAFAGPAEKKSMQSVRGRHKIGRRELRRSPTLEHCLGTCEPHLTRFRWIVGSKKAVAGLTDRPHVGITD